ncbi:CvpA family protein [uncultured Pseudoflavonifractor sp.]|uniref:CvpA family protein n=1 Tax=uncultured Pseudoflavonifractor sp. TaxID=1221379 RepID=UPI0025DB43E8|nr:CvpA family protein [uncultured Pseudoflavonifractor sp.]
MAYLIFDIAILVILALFAWRGASRGFVLSLCGLLAVIVAFVGASFLAGLLAPKVGTALEPKFAQAIEERLEEQFQQSGPAGDAAGQAEGESYPLQDVLSVLKDMGLYEELVDTIDQAVQDGMTTVAANAAAAVAAAIAQSVAYTVIFTAAFALILIAWTIFSHAVDLVTKLPGLNFLNKTGGAAMGLVKGVIILFLAAWIIQYTGKLIPEETVQQTHLLKFFMTTNPLALLQGL